MTPNDPLTAITELAAKLNAKNDGLKAHFTSFKSGSAMLDVKRNGQAWVLAYSPSRGYGVDQLHSDQGITTQFSFVSDHFEPAARRLAELTQGESCGPLPTISLLALHARDIEKSKEFYSVLGLGFSEEVHGTGPRHYAAVVNGFVFEIYPRQQHDGAALRIGFHVAQVDSTVDRLQGHGARIISEPKDSPWGRRAVVEDPDGNRVELSTP